MAFVHGRQTRLLLDNYDISRYFREVGRTNSADQVDTTTFGADYKDFIAGNQESGVTLGGLFESSTQIGPTATDTTDKYLSDALGRRDPALVLSIGWEGFAHGKRVSLFKGTELGYETSSPVSDVTSVSVSLSSDGPSRTGVSLHDLTAENASGSSASVDNGSQSTDGGFGQLHVTLNGRDGATDVRIQHSSDNGSVDPWTDLVVFTSVPSSTAASERVSVEGTVKRYTRAIWTLAGTSGTVTFQTSFARA